jgi:TonB family protein
MRLTLLESNRSFFQSAECALLSILAHGAIVWFAMAATSGGVQMPADEREARVFFLLPPDRVDVHARQSRTVQWGRLGSDMDDGKLVTRLGSEGPLVRVPTHGARKSGRQTGARGQVPFGPLPPYVPDTAFSVLDVDEMAERYESSAAPIYPRELLALGMEGSVQAIYVVDSTGMVDTTMVQVVRSDDPRFTESVRDALGRMRFRPAKRAGKPVRQLVAQQFRFHIEPPPTVAKRMS